MPPNLLHKLYCKGHVLRNHLNALTFVNRHYIGATLDNFLAMAEPNTPKPITANLLFITTYLSRACSRSANRSSTCSMPTERRIKLSVTPTFSSFWYGSVCHRRRMTQRLDASQAFCKVITFKALTTSAVFSKPSSFTVKLPSRQFLHLTLGNLVHCVLLVLAKHLVYCRMSLQEVCYRSSIFTMSVHERAAF